jgi:hypothetical protein
VADRFPEEAEEGLADRREGNGRHKVARHYQWWLCQVVAGSPRDYGQRRPTWTQELPAIVPEQQTGTRLSTATLSRLRRRHRSRRGRPEPTAGCPWPRAKERRRWRRRPVRCCPAGEVVVYADEVGSHLNPRIGPDSMPRGTRKWVVTPGKNEKRYSAGALNAQAGKRTWEEWHSKGSDPFLGLLHRLARDYPGPGGFMWSWTTTRATRASGRGWRGRRRAGACGGTSCQRIVRRQPDRAAAEGAA